MLVFARFSAGETRNLKDFGLSRYVGKACDKSTWLELVYYYFPDATFQKCDFRTLKLHPQGMISI